jgi:hypothetical protein
MRWSEDDHCIWSTLLRNFELHTENTCDPFCLLCTVEKSG